MSLRILSSRTIQSIYISKSTNPYFNLTFEDWLFRHKTPEEPLLLIYRDDPCVIIGRNQNPWKEVNFRALKERPGVPFIRRRSGGGTVYHDLGNTNYSIHVPRHSFDRRLTAQVVLRAVQSFRIDARVNDRNDICVGDEKMSHFFLPLYIGYNDDLFRLHVSGSAYKIVNNRAYHHGTMLLSTRLDTLGDLLHTDKRTMVTKGVASVRSPVCNLQQFSRQINHDTFANAVVKEFQKEYKIDSPAQIIDADHDYTSIEYIRKGMEELQSWNWAYGQTPQFTYTIEHRFPWGKVVAQIQSRHGIIDKCDIDISETNLEGHTLKELINVGQLLEGKQYGLWGDLWEHQKPSQHQLEVSEWLKEMAET